MLVKGHSKEQVLEKSEQIELVVHTCNLGYYQRQRSGGLQFEASMPRPPK
jgi:hypothetical protein